VITDVGAKVKSCRPPSEPCTGIIDNESLFNCNLFMWYYPIADIWFPGTCLLGSSSTSWAAGCILLLGKHCLCLLRTLYLKQVPDLIDVSLFCGPMWIFDDGNHMTALSHIFCSKSHGFDIWVVQRWRWVSVHVLQQREDIWMILMSGVQLPCQDKCICAIPVWWPLWRHWTTRTYMFVYMTLCLYIWLFSYLCTKRSSMHRQKLKIVYWTSACVSREFKL